MHQETDDAYLEAQRIGKGPALCAPDSHFLEAYNNCVSCSQENDPSLKAADTTFLGPSFRQFVEYCGIKDVLVTLILRPTVANREVPLTLTTRVNIPESFTAITSTQSPGSSGVPSASTNSTFTTHTSVAIGSSTSISPSPSPSPATAPTAIPEEQEGGHSQAWIAGTVIGSLAGMAFIIATLIFLLQQRRKATRARAWANEAMDKPQLHSDCLPRPLPNELENSESRPPVELPEPLAVDSAAEGGPHELPDPRNPRDPDLAVDTVSELEAPITQKKPRRQDTGST
ncbi:hypothetical protein PG996_005837 [Apiospora saccharicola]|uniref:Uncharacterized protein n=1 Tax=Apiospora saccharicola TaxID=335842 RepID=A0ABR1VMK7_9PEZI